MTPAEKARRELIVACFKAGQNQAAIGRVMHISRQRVHQILLKEKVITGKAKKK